MLASGLLFYFKQKEDNMGAYDVRDRSNYSEFEGERRNPASSAASGRAAIMARSAGTPLFLFTTPVTVSAISDMSPRS